ncbi:SHORT VEGETATIVE PHASE, Flowering Arabidopsis QTL1, AGAMOUS-like 22 [Hibiscus trionum]|uniref:SHORT VEGETATIVE PHASE, Flowering Arabidopsis QTL1, AGAMOUS-like 22 n=1 Tax=Hibiscus trionum TaxID=183268 RepID=A0A9W7JJM3_HIBTR|nr:SHORT VEGETATIVE PHASE, Flowering Arabidopsis QTL1, AGAMOUS-like 22 [Hibiscus trionum]
MTRKKIQIKRIEDTAARQVSFSKRRRGLFKKAHELSVLCDAEVAAVVFSATGKLFEHSSTSTEQVIERRNRQSEKGFDRLASTTPSLEHQLERSRYALLGKELAEKTHQLRQLRGEELRELDYEELIHLEKLVQGGLSRVVETKDERFFKEISSLKMKEAELMEENQQLKQQPENVPGRVRVQAAVTYHRKPSESIAHAGSSENQCQDNNSFDISLRLGLPFPNSALKG